MQLICETKFATGYSNQSLRVEVFTYGKTRGQASFLQNVSKFINRIIQPNRTDKKCFVANVTDGAIPVILSPPS